MLADPIQGVIVLSSGSNFNPPSIIPLPGDTWPAGATCYTVFKDTSGGVLAQITGTVSTYAVDFNSPFAAVDGVPAGANFETFVVDSAPHKIRYGKVVRRDPTYPNAPGNTITAPALQFSDTLQRTALGSKWIPVSGTTQIFNNTGSSLPYGVGPPNVLLGSSNSAIRWYTPLNSDSVQVNVNMLNMGSGKTGIVLCADILFSSYLAVQFDEPTHAIHLCVGTGPAAVTYEGAAITNTLANGDNYTIDYNFLTKTLAVYKGTSTAPLGTPWVDSGNLVPHGPGYRYTGFNWINGNLSNGLQVSGWSAQDQV